MKKNLLFFLCTLLPFFVVAQHHRVIISELLYHTPLNEGRIPDMYNGEFATIYNYGNVPVDISGWFVVSDGQRQTFTFPEGSIMQPRARFIVAHSSPHNNFVLSDLFEGFELGENDRVFYERNIIHANAGESFRLYRADGATQDSLRYEGTSQRTLRPRLEASNVRGTPGRQCVSLQRRNVTVDEDGVIVFCRLDWATDTVVLERPFRVALTENGKPVADNEEPVEELSFSELMNHIFQHVDTTLIPTGLLSDWGMQLVEPYIFDGTLGDNNFVNMDIWRMLYFGMATSQINHNITILPSDMVFKQIDNATHPDAVPLAMMHFQYNSLNEYSPYWIVDTIAEQIHHAPGAIAESLYLTRQLFAVAPKVSVFRDRTVSFVFNPNLWHTNSDKPVQNLDINFNNESGWITADWNTPISHTFNSGGTKTIYFRLTYAGGVSYISQSQIHVENEPVLNAPVPPGISPDTTVIINAEPGVHYGGRIEIKFSTNNHTGRIRKPLIVAEGFDASTVLGADILSNSNISTFLGQLNVLRSVNPRRYLRDDILAEYDIIFLDYFNGVACIWSNARLFRQVIDSVNKWKVGDEPNVVMGLSMGGLVARIALRQIEIDIERGVPNVQPHQTRKFISVDSPHKGANIPIGAQRVVRFADNFMIYVSICRLFRGCQTWVIHPLTALNDVFGISLGLDIVELLNSPAARQMLIYNLDQTGSHLDNSEHTAFMQAYTDLGMPRGFSLQPITNVAISNGSASTTLFAPGSPIIHWQDEVISGLTVNAGLNAVNSIGASNLDVLSMSVRYRNRIRVSGSFRVRYININITFLDWRFQSPQGIRPLDGTPGGTMGVNQFDEIVADFSEFIKQRNFSFIPTGSSLALPNWYASDVSGLISTSPFDMVFVPNLNESHVNFNSSAGFLYNLLIVGIPTIVGTDTICAEGFYTLNNPSLRAGSWAVSPVNDFTIISSDSTYARIGATRLDGQSGVLTAVVGGETITRNIRACSWSGNISGPSLFCDEGYFTIFPAPPAEVTISWQAGQNITLSQSSGPTVAAYRNDGTSGYSWISARLSLPGAPNFRTFHRDFHMGVPTPHGIASLKHGTVSTSWGEFEDFITYYDIVPLVGNSYGIIAGVWQEIPGGGVIFTDDSPPRFPINQIYGTGRILAAGFSGSNTVARINVRLQNQCSWSGWRTIEYLRPLPPPPTCPCFPPCPECKLNCPIPCLFGCHHCIGICHRCHDDDCDGINCRWRFTFSPNPVSDVLTIDFRPETLETRFATESRTLPDLIFNIRLYDRFGNIVRRHNQVRSGEIQLDLSNLPEGTYYLHIERNGEIRKEQIIVER